MKQPLSKLVPDYVSQIRPYVPGKPMEEVERELGVTAIKLASNENAFGPSPKAVEAMKKHLAASNRYPDAGGFYLREKLAEKHGVKLDQLVLGCGSTELIQLLCRIYCPAGAVGVSSEGSFVMFALSVQASGGKAVLVPLKEHAFDLDALAAAVDARTRAVYLANPNNPTGTMFTAGEMDNFLKKVPENVLVILDEAYCDYVERADYSRSLDLVRSGRYLIVLRTFSKVYGLAGARIGYGIGHPEVIAALNNVRSPFNVSNLAQVAALAALDDTEHVRRSVELNRQGRAFLAAEFAKLGFTVVPSETNFIYIETGNDTRAEYEALLGMGVIVRPMGFMGLPAGLRVTVGTPEENQRMLEAFARLPSARA